MVKPKYLPEEIERMIDEEIARIDAANSAAAAEALERRKNRHRSLPARISGFFRERFRSFFPTKK